MTETLDVVIPVRDVDDYLGEAIESATQQSGVSTIVYVVDAGSRHPIALPRPFDDRPDVRLLRSDAPLRAGAARNLGAAEGGSAWISFLDADDVWEPGSRRALIDAAVSARSDLAVGTVVHFHADRSAQRLRLPPDGQRALVPGGVVVRRDAWDQVGPFDPDLAVGEFIEWWNRARMAGVRESSIETAVLRRRLHLQSLTATRSPDRNDYLEVVRRWIAQKN